MESKLYNLWNLSFLQFHFLEVAYRILIDHDKSRLKFFILFINFKTKNLFFRKEIPQTAKSIAVISIAKVAADWGLEDWNEFIIKSSLLNQK